MSEKQVSQEMVQKALTALQTLAKGHSSRGTSTTEVDSMRDGSVGAGSSAGATQVYHTPSNSDPKSWAGSSARYCPEDGATDAIEEDGTDYKGGAEMVKSILSKIAKGIPLNKAEQQVFAAFAKGDYGMDPKEDKEEKAEKAGMMYSMKDKEDAKKAGYSEDDDKKEMMGKSLAQHAEENEEVNKGLEMSSFLLGWADVHNKALASSQNTIVKEVRKSLANVVTQQESFNGELAKSIAQLADVLTLQAQRIEQLEATPARGPKTQTAVALEKSFGTGAPSETEITKSQALNIMTNMVEAGKLSATEVIKFESTGNLSKAVEEQVLAYRAGR